MSAEAPPGGAPVTGEGDTPGDEARRRRWARVLIAVACLLVLLGSVGVLYDGTLVWLNRLAHPFLFGCVAAAAFGVGACRLISTHALRVMVAVVTIAVGGAWFVIGFLWVSIAGMSLFPAATADAPGDREYKAVVHKGPAFLGESDYAVSIRQTRGLLSREWPVGCISDAGQPDMSIYEVRWETPSRLRVALGWEGYGITITVDPRTGKPESPHRATC